MPPREQRMMKKARATPIWLLLVIFMVTVSALLGLRTMRDWAVSFIPLGETAGGNRVIETLLDGDWKTVTAVAKDTDLCDAEHKTACQRYDAVVMLGGGPQDKDGKLPEWTKRRCDAVLELQKCCDRFSQPGSPQQLLVITTSAGSAHAPNFLDPEGFVITEADAAADYLISGGMKKENIVQETAAWDTIGNAWFARIMHTDIRAWHRLLVITSDFHMSRSRAIFEWIMSLPPLKGPYTLGFLAVSDAGIDMVEQRAVREAKSEAGVKKNAARLRSMGAVHAWLNTEHQAYASGTALERLQGDERKMYNG